MAKSVELNDLSELPIRTDLLGNESSKECRKIPMSLPPVV